MLKRIFLFRPWVRRAGLSIVLVAAAVTISIAAALAFDPGARYGWMGERPVWVYLCALWLGKHDGCGGIRSAARSSLSAVTD